MSDELAFNSKIDLWLLILIGTGVAACLWGAAEIWDGNRAVLWPVAAILLIGILVPLWALISLRYFLSDDSLRVRCGPFNWRIPIGDIRAVTPTTSARAGPAMSFDRLQIDYGENGSLLISPEPRDEFLRQLEHRRRQAD